MGQPICVEADEVKTSHTTTLGSEAAHATKNAGLVKQQQGAVNSLLPPRMIGLTTEAYGASLKARNGIDQRKSVWR